MVFPSLIYFVPKRQLFLRLFGILLIFLTVLVPAQLCAQASGDLGDSLATIIEPKPARVFSARYAGVLFGRQFPYADMQPYYRAGGLSPGLVYSYFLSDEWMTEIRIGFLSFLTKGGAGLNLFNIGFGSTRFYRLSHPIYAGWGLSLFFFYPIEESRFPPKQVAGSARETGVSLHATFLYKISNRLSAVAKIERWQGVDSSRYKSIGVSAGLLFSLSAD